MVSELNVSLQWILEVYSLRNTSCTHFSTETWRVKVKFTLKSIFTYPNCDAYYHNLYYININLHYNDNVAIGSYCPVPFAALVTSDEIWFVSKVELVFKY